MEYALLFAMYEYQLRCVVDAYPNASFHFHQIYEPFPVACFNILAPRLKAIFFSDTFNDINYAGWQNTWNKRIHLRELYVYSCHELKEIETIFSTPKEHFGVLELAIPQYVDAEYVKNVMDVCAKGTKCIEHSSCADWHSVEKVQASFLQRTDYFIVLCVCNWESHIS